MDDGVPRPFSFTFFYFSRPPVGTENRMEAVQRQLGTFEKAMVRVGKVEALVEARGRILLVN